MAVARRVRSAALPGVTVAELEGDQFALLYLRAGAADVSVIDAVCSGGEPGTTYRLDASHPLGPASGITARTRSASLT